MSSDGVWPFSVRETRLAAWCVLVAMVMATALVALREGGVL